MTCEKIDRLIRQRLPVTLAAWVLNSAKMLTGDYPFIDETVGLGAFNQGLEVGRDAGWSALMFTLMNPKARLISIDIQGFTLNKAVFTDLGVAHRIDCRTGDSRDEAMWKNVPKLDYALIDGAHDYETAKSDWDHIVAAAGPGCCVLLDNLDHPAGCGRVFEEIEVGRKVAFSDSLGMVLL